MASEGAIMAKKKPDNPGDKIAKKAKLIADQSVSLADYAAKALDAATLLRVKSKPVEGLWLDHDERALLSMLPAVAAKTKKKLAKPDGVFSVAEAAGFLFAVADAFILAGGNQKR